MSGTQNGRSPRSVALVGPYSSGKSTLFEALMEAAGAPVKRPADPRNRPATTEVRLGHCSYLGDAWAVLDCPGSIEFAYETGCALAMVDLAVVVCEPAPGPRADRGAAPQAAGGRRRAAHAVHQQDRHAGRQRERHAGGAAGLCRLAAGAAPGADHGWRDGQRLCRCGERTGVSLPQGPGLGADAGSVRDAGRRAGGAEQARRGAGGSRRRAAGEGAGGCEAHDRGDLHRSSQGSRGGRGDRGAARFGGECRRCAAAVEGAAPRHADAGRRPRRARAIDADGPPLAQVFKTVHAGHTGKLSYARIWRGSDQGWRHARRHAAGRHLSHAGRRAFEGRRGGRGRRGRAGPAGWRADRRHGVAWRDAGAVAVPRARRRRCIRWRSRPPTTRTMRSSAARCRSSARRTRRCRWSSSRTPARPCCTARARCT